MTAPLVVLDHATILRGGRAVLQNFSWTIREGETWAITGSIGSGKTTLAETLLGKHFAATDRWRGRCLNASLRRIHRR